MAKIAMPASAGNCCTLQEERDSVDAARFGLPDPRELHDDPVLAGCCEDDLRNLRLAEVLHKVLLDVDRSTARLKLQQQALHNPDKQRQQEQQPDSDSDWDDDDDDDHALSELRQRRLAELQRQAAERKQLGDRGYGCLNDVPPGALLDRVEQLEGPRTAVVAHLAVGGCEAGALLDEHLACLAHRQRGTFFCRVPVNRGDALTARLRLGALPALVCFRAGAVVGRAPVSQFGPPGSLVEEEVTSYLKRMRVLREEASAGSRGHAVSVSEDDQRDEEEEEEWRLTPCDVCGRRYPHEHVRAVYGTCQQRSDSSADEDR